MFRPRGNPNCKQIFNMNLADGERFASSRTRNATRSLADIGTALRRMSRCRTRTNIQSPRTPELARMARAWPRSHGRLARSHAIRDFGTTTPRQVALRRGAYLVRPCLFDHYSASDWWSKKRFVLHSDDPSTWAIFVGPCRDC
jgi:hypothetical protein